jgi:hypothetical protein
MEDAQLLEAIRLGREQLGEDHPLVVDAIRSLRAKERRRVTGAGDGLTAEISHAFHDREKKLALLLREMLNEDPVHEALIPGFGKRRVDMYFLGYGLIVEENGVRHSKLRKTKQRDADLRELCAHSGLRLLEVDYREPLTDEHLLKRLRDIGIAA